MTQERRIKRKKLQRKHLLLAKSFDRRGRLIATATNNYIKTHPMQSHFAKLAGMPEYDKLHAEVLCLLRSRDKQVYKLTIERYTADGKPAMAKPCAICMKAIEAFKVNTVEYTTVKGFVNAN